MLENDRLESRSDVCIFFLNSEHSEDVAIFCFYKMLFNRIFVEITVLNEWIFGIGMGCSYFSGKNEHNGQKGESK